MNSFKIQIPESFLKEEVRCDYTVSQKMKKIWAVELDLLAEFDRVCEKYNLRYFAVGGTLLGAARHKGFIPWDDDIDVAMFRNDYEKICEIGKTEFNHPYYFQSPYVSIEEKPLITDTIRLRNSNTTAIDDMQFAYSPNSNQGIFIDIFPLDNVPDDDKKRDKQIYRIKRYQSFFRNCFFCTKTHIWKHPNPIIRASRWLIASLFNNSMRALSDYYFDKYVKECKRYNCMKTRRVGQLMFVLDTEKLIFEREDCDKIMTAPFEFSTIPIGVGFDRMLSHQFGDWHKMVKGTAYHTLEDFDAERPYTDVIR